MAVREVSANTFLPPLIQVFPRPLVSRPVSGVSAGETAAALKLRQRAELQLSNLLTVPRTVPALSVWDAQGKRFTTQSPLPCVVTVFGHFHFLYQLLQSSFYEQHSKNKTSSSLPRNNIAFVTGTDSAN